MGDFKALKEKLLKSRELYEDPDFPANSKALYSRSESAPSLQWKRPKDISRNAKFMVHGATYYDMQQGELDNCWFVAGVVTLAASNWKLFKRVVPLDQEFDEQYAGIFHFYFWQYGEWKEVIVDDRLPTRNGELIYAANRKQPNEFWCPILEKAYAKLYGCYEYINHGLINIALVDLTGGISEDIQMQGGKSLDELAKYLLSLKRMNTLMGGAIFNKPGSNSGEVLRSNGLYEGHAYSIVDIKKVEHLGKRKMLLRVRNPWGRGEWNGPWSDRSPEWGQLSPSESLKIDHEKIPNGEFWISLEDFKEQFDEMEMCHLNPDAFSSEIASEERKKEWSVHEFTGSWIRGVTSGGPMTSFTSKLFWKNPQYKVHLDKADKPISVIVNLMEVSDKRVRDVDDVEIGFIIFKLQEGREPVCLSSDNFYEFMPKLEKTSGMFWPYRGRTVRFELEPSVYIIVPCTAKPSMEADFYLRVMAEEPPKVEPVVTPTGPITDEVNGSKDYLETLFRKHAGSDGTVDAVGLRRVLSDMEQKVNESKDGFTLETCRSFVSLKDKYTEGTVDYSQVQEIWTIIKLCREAFVSFDRDFNNAVDVYELGDLFRKIGGGLGFSLSVGIRKALVRRYGGREGKIYEEDFIQSFCKVLTLHQKFKQYSQSGYINMNMNKWIESALYI